MKHALLSTLLLATVLPLSGQTTGDAQGGKVEMVTATSNMRFSEEQEVIAASSALITTSVDLREDGSARCTHQIGTFSTRIEFRGLNIHEIVKVPVTAEDKQQGISRRYIARLVCKAHRIWDGPMLAWSEWRENGYGFFPSTVVVEEVHGELKARANHIADFSPGIDATTTAAR